VLTEVNTMPRRDAYRRWGKRTLDLAVAAPATLALLPVMLAVGVTVLVTLGRPMFYRDRRAGLAGAPFVLRKFRTMLEHRDGDGQLLPDGQRLTRVGRLLRAWSVDELPQLFSVLRGQMSLVGPRPLPCRYVERYSADQARRLQVKPGITGLAQVRGRNATSWESRFEQDTYYVDHCSLRLDVAVLVATVGVVLRREGVSHPGHETMHEFTGARQ
jgi:sugar transferase EpsL